MIFCSTSPISLNVKFLWKWFPPDKLIRKLERQSPTIFLYLYSFFYTEQVEAETSYTVHAFMKLTQLSCLSHLHVGIMDMSNNTWMTDSIWSTFIGKWKECRSRQSLYMQFHFGTCKVCILANFSYIICGKASWTLVGRQANTMI